MPGPTADGGVALTDLSLERMSDPPPQLRPSEQTSLTFVVRGRGQSPSPMSSIRVWLVPEDPDDGAMRTEVAAVLVPAMGPDGEQNLEGQLEIPPGILPTFYRLEAVVDPDDNIFELTEINNRIVSAPIAVSSIELQPDALDFGVVGLDCRVSQSFSVVNRGDASAFIRNLRLVDPAPFRLGPFEPTLLLSGRSLQVDVGFEPTEAGLNERSIEIDHDQFLTAMTLPIRGYGLKDPPRTDSHMQWTRPRIDVLFVVDNSQSMLDQQPQLSRQASTFFQYMLDERIDFHIGVITSEVYGDAGGVLLDPGRVGGVLTPETDDGAHLFATTLDVPLRADMPEQGLNSALLAISEPNRSTVNAGFLRPNASLAIIFISDDDDASPGEVDTYLRAFWAQREPEGMQRVVVNAVVAPGTGCSTAVEAGTRYASLVEASQGVSESICDFDWTTALRTFPGPGFGFRNRFELNRPPLDTDGIEVFINGNRLPEADNGRLIWWYDSTTNEVVFEPTSVPEPRYLVEIDYNSKC